MKNLVDECAREFSAQTHGSTDFDKENLFIKGAGNGEFVPIGYLLKKHPEIEGLEKLQSIGYVYSSCDYLELSEFDDWYNKQFGKRLGLKNKKDIGIVHFPDTKKIFEAVEIVDQVYRILKDHKVLINGKNLPVQLGEWYSKSIFGLKQIKSASQRGFDFEMAGGEKVEVKVHWQDVTSPKGVKIKKSLVELSDYTVVIYVAKNFTIRDILLLDSDFVLRKFGSKGHTIFLKDADVSGYFFSKSNKHYDKIKNKSALLKFASPNLAIKIDEKLRSEPNK